MKKNFKLFFIIPILGIKKTKQKTALKILGLPVYIRKSNKNGTKIKYKFLGIPILKIKKG